MSATVCESCGQNPATFHHTEIDDDGSKSVVHVCEECAATQGLSGEGALPGMLKDLGQALVRGAALESLTCPDCGMTFKEFRRRGRLGCPNDYEAFQAALLPLLQKMHAGASEHVGRLPEGRADSQRAADDRLVHLRRMQQEAIDAERYEEAARLRDEITGIEKARRAERRGAGG
jgi:protein arginine kinase activator